MLSECGGIADSGREGCGGDGAVPGSEKEVFEEVPHAAISVDCSWEEEDIVGVEGWEECWLMLAGCQFYSQCTPVGSRQGGFMGVSPWRRRLGAFLGVRGVVR